MPLNSTSRPIERIREETREEHERTEGALERRFFGPGEPGREEYAELLAAFMGVYGPLEERLAPAVDRHLPSFPFRCRTGRLRRDLRTLGLADDEIDALPSLGRDHLPVLRGAPSALGCLYVVEGSQLGHRVLWKQVRDTLDPEAAEADAFLAVPAERARSRWERFGEVFDRRISSDDAFSTAVNTAHSTFRAYRQWLA